METKETHLMKINFLEMKNSKMMILQIFPFLIIKKVLDLCYTINIHFFSTQEVFVPNNNSIGEAHVLSNP